MRLDIWVAQSEYREWERQFNVGAARGEFVPNFEQPQRRKVQLRLRPRIEQLRAVRRTASLTSLVGRQVDSLLAPSNTMCE